MPQLGPMEILVVAVIALVVFGPHRLPEMARTVGKYIAEFRRQANELSNEFKLGLDEEDEDEPAGEERFDQDLRFDEDDDESPGRDGFDRDVLVDEIDHDEDIAEDDSAGPEVPDEAPGVPERPPASELNGRRASPLSGSRDAGDEEAAEGRG